MGDLRNRGFLLPLLREGADIDMRFNGGRTALHYAARSCRIDFIEMLLEHGASAGAMNDDMFTPLHYAVVWGGIKAVAALMKARDIKSTINSKDCFYNTPLHFAVWASELEIVKVLMGNGASIEVQNKNLDTPLHLAAYRGLCDIIELLANSEAVGMRNEYGHTPLSCAIEARQFSAFKALMNSADEASKNALGYTPLHLAALGGQYWSIKQLHDARNDVNARTVNEGITPLHCAVMYAGCETFKNNFVFERNGFSIIDLLVQYGADINAQDVHGRTPLHTAVLWAKMEETALIIFKLESSDTELIARLLQRGANPDIQDFHKYTPLHIAAHCDDRDAIKTLIDGGAAIDVAGKDGNTALHIAVQKKSLNAIVALLDSGACMECKGERGMTALLMAVNSGAISIAGLLIYRGANRFAECDEKKNAFFYAIKGEKKLSPYVIAFLLKDKFPQSENGLKPSLVEVLREHGVYFNARILPPDFPHDSLLLTHLAARFVFAPDMNQEYIGERCSQCSSALSPGDILSRTPCGHVFHDACLLESLKQQESQECPACTCGASLKRYCVMREKVERNWPERNYHVR